MIIYCFSWEAGIILNFSQSLRRVTYRVLLALLVDGLFCAAPAIAQAGKIRQVDEKTKSQSRPEGSTQQRASANTSSVSQQSSDKSDSEETGPLTKVVVFTLFAPFTVPYYLSKLEDAPEPVLAPQMFAPGCGMMCTPDTQEADYWKPLATTFALEGGGDIAGIPFVGAEARLFSSFGLELSSRLQYFRELDQGAVEHAWLGKSHLAYRFAEWAHVQFRAGLGPQYLFGSVDGAAGIDFLYGLDIQWAKPVSTEFEFDIGTLGSAFSAEVRGTLGVWWGPLQIYAGWDQHWIGGVPLGGPLGGVRAYL